MRSDIGGLLFPRACMLVCCRVGERSDHRAIRAYNLGTERRRAASCYSIGTNLRRNFLGGKPRWLVSIRRSRLRALPASVRRTIAGQFCEFTFGPSQWRPLDRLFIRNNQPSEKWARHGLYHSRRTASGRDMEPRTRSGRDDLGCNQQRAAAA